ncbi:MarR family winged helix-turn-helix transcriptional regulator [Rhodococcus spongiicola]|uniref:MarR family transcriptional regulator n=1 Tax=Rhodococcus spongiicola TaxID=2487352 RepID=A0A438ARX9_9NOCA|nr:MarR family transcriptional regulator [Rhodococcus spongiicola]RVW01460.1 MarR family transcriptional regulator [Rhodococcus spongiicola]
MDTTDERCLHAPPADAVAEEVRWLTADELDTWHALNLLLAKLPAALGAQLQCDAGLSFVEYYVLAGLSDQPNHTARMSNLAVIANSELSRLSHLMRRLEKRGYVRREPDPTDGRFTNAILTDEGLAHLTTAAPGHVAAVRNLVFDALGTAEQQALRTAAYAITAQLDGACGASDTGGIREATAERDRPRV